MTVPLIVLCCLMVISFFLSAFLKESDMIKVS